MSGKLFGADTAAIMAAREIADHAMRGAKRIGKVEISELAHGFQRCDAQRAAKWREAEELKRKLVRAIAMLDNPSEEARRELAAALVAELATGEPS